MNILLGCHTKNNAPDYLLGSVTEMLDYGANCLMIYTGAPQNSIRLPIEKMNIDAALSLLEKNNITPDKIIIHAPYIINLASDDISKQEFAREYLCKEIQRANFIKAKYIIVHPGNNVILENGIQNIVTTLNYVLKHCNNDVVILLENMSGRKNDIGASFDELSSIIQKITLKNRIGICFDTCHAFCYGYDIVEKYQEFKDHLRRLAIFKHIKVIHLNDSKINLGGKNDRHANIGDGFIGLDALKKITYDIEFDVPKILETPYVNDLPPYKEEIKKLLS